MNEEQATKLIIELRHIVEYLSWIPWFYIFYVLSFLFRNDSKERIVTIKEKR
jgi:hypothetical protein